MSLYCRPVEFAEVVGLSGLPPKLDHSFFSVVLDSLHFSSSLLRQLIMYMPLELAITACTAQLDIPYEE